MSIAARVAGYKKKYGGFVTSLHASGPIATSATGLKVEIFIDESWQDISKDVRYDSRIVISGGRNDESSQLQKSTCRFTLNNRNGKYSPRNPSSPYYGKIGRNTLIRVSTEQSGVVRYRFYGEIVAWPVQWDVSDTDIFVPVEGSGILRRLNQGVKPLRSSMYRTLIREAVAPKAYWPCEDGTESTSLGSGISGQPAMTVFGVVSTGSYTGFLASGSIPTLGAGGFTGQVTTSYTVDSVTGFLKIRFLLNVPSGGTTNGAVLLRVNQLGTTTARYDILYLTTSSGTLRLAAYNASGALVDTATDLTTCAINGKDVMVAITLNNSITGNTIGAITVVYDDGTVSTNTAVVIAANTIDKVTAVTVTPGSDCSGVSIGHIMIQTEAGTASQTLLDGHNGESPFVRISRLCTEENISFTGTDASSNVTTMGVQNVDTLVNLINDCVKADLGLLYETRDQLGLGYIPRPSLYNRTAKLTLSYTTNDLLSPATPVDDDQQTKNDVEMIRKNGSSARTIKSTGPLSVLPPPNGVGLYDISDTINIATDAQLLDQVAWRLFLGTVDEPRYPEIEVHLQRNSFTASYDLTAAALTAAIGDRITITGQPSHEGGEQIDVLVQAYTETIDQFEHRIKWNGAPESPYEVAVTNINSSNTLLGRADTAGSNLRVAVSETATQWEVNTTSGPSWVTTDDNASEFPFDIKIDGEVVRVTSILGTQGIFESGVAGWTPNSGTFVQSSTQRYKGNFSGLLTVTGAPSQTYVRPVTPAIVTPGNSYTATMYLYSTPGDAVSASIDWSDAGGVYISTTAANFTLPVTTWTRCTVTGTAPVGAKFGSYGPTITGSPTAGDAIFADEVTFSPYDAQIFNVTRSINGISRAHVAGVSISLAYPMVVAL